MSAHRNSWKVRIASVSIGCLDRTSIPNWPGKNPKPKASSGPPMPPTLFRSNPDGMPVLEGAMNRCG